MHSNCVQSNELLSHGLGECGFLYNSALPAMNESIDLANAYIQNFQEFLERFAEDSKAFETAKTLPLNISESELGAKAFAQVHFNSPSPEI
jgi:hypothetical protein